MSTRDWISLGCVEDMCLSQSGQVCCLEVPSLQRPEHAKVARCHDFGFSNLERDCCKSPTSSYVLKPPLKCRHRQGKTQVIIPNKTDKVYSAKKKDIVMCYFV